MTLEQARKDLQTGVRDLWAAVAELMLIAVEDEPDTQGLAAVDDLTEQISEMQGSVAAAAALLEGDGEDFVIHVADITRHLDEARTRYWQQLRGHDRVQAVRTAVRRCGGSWPAWQRTVEESSRRCEQPFEAVARSLYACWHEVSQLLAIYERSAGSAGSSASSASPMQRRTL
jgi:hypothetical protein